MMKKMIMKKALFLTWLLVAAMLVAGCGKKAPAAPAAPAAPVEPPMGFFSQVDSDDFTCWAILDPEEGGILFFQDVIEVTFDDEAIYYSDGSTAYTYTWDGKTLTLTDEDGSLTFVQDSEDNFDTWLETSFFSGADGDYDYAEDSLWDAELSLLGAWNLESGETEGYQWYAEEEGIHSDIDILYDEYGLLSGSYFYEYEYGDIICGDMYIDLSEEESWLCEGTEWHGVMSGYGTDHYDGEEADVYVEIDMTIDPQTGYLICAPMTSYDDGNTFDGLATFYYAPGTAVG